MSSHEAADRRSRAWLSRLAQTELQREFVDVSLVILDYAFDVLRRREVGVDPDLNGYMERGPLISSGGAPVVGVMHANYVSLIEFAAVDGVPGWGHVERTETCRRLRVGVALFAYTVSEGATDLFAVGNRGVEVIHLYASRDLRGKDRRRR